jgi:hypothetical protein
MIYIRGVPFKFLNFRGNAANLRIGNSKQLVFIPRRYFNNNGTIKENMNLGWFMDKYDTKHKVELAKLEDGE